MKDHHKINARSNLINHDPNPATRRTNHCQRLYQFFRRLIASLRSNSEISPPIHHLPNELLLKIIDKLPRTQWPSLELIDRKFRDAVLLAWGSLRAVDIDRDFIYYFESKAVDINDENAFEMVEERLRRQITRKTETILKKLIDRSPLITSLSGVSFLCDSPPRSRLNTTSVGYLSEFEHLETMKFTKNYFTRIVNGREFDLDGGGIHLIDLVAFVESTQSRGTLRKISIDQCYIPDGSQFDRLRSAFASLELESFSIWAQAFGRPLTTFDTIRTSRLTKLCFGLTHVEPSVLTTLINGAPRLRHIDFGFVHSCTNECDGGRLQSNEQLLAALESCANLQSLCINRIWDREDICVCHRFEAEFVKMLYTIGPQLETLALECDYLPPTIRMIEICDIVRNRMPHLKSIKLSACDLDPEDLRGIADDKELEAIQLNVSFRDTNLANDILSTIVQKSHRLQRFNVDNFAPDQRVLKELCKLNRLIDLRIRGSKLTKENFLAFSRVFAENLEVLCLEFVAEGVESGLIEFISVARRLRVLEVNRFGSSTSRTVTDQFLKCVAESCPKLEKFRARSTDGGITFDGVQILVDGCSELRWLDVNNMAGTLKSCLGALRFEQYRKPPCFSRC